METMLTIKERKYAQELINDSKNLQGARWPEWAGLVLFAIGGFLIVSACFIVVGNLHVTSIKYVLFPGIVMGLGMILFGTFIQRSSEKSEEQRVLVSLVRKLMTQRDGR